VTGSRPGSQELRRHGPSVNGTHDPEEASCAPPGRPYLPSAHVSTLVLVRHAPTAATRSASFPVDEPVEADALEAAAALGQRLPSRALALCSPARRARQTAEAVGLKPRIDDALAECDFGSWSGRSLAELHTEDPVATETWMTDSDSAPHGGESLSRFSARVSAWIDAQAQRHETVVAVTHSGVIAAAVAHAIGAPVEAVWRLRPDPLTITELDGADGRWTVRRVGA
jgi:broad specificity phosphatase PhoE